MFVKLANGSIPVFCFIFKPIINNRKLITNWFLNDSRIVLYSIVKNHIASFRIDTYRIVWWLYRLIPSADNKTFCIH